MRALILPLVLLILAACSNASESASETSNSGETKLAAVLMYADWCGSCKELDPKLKAVQAKGDIPGVEYVVLDYTARDSSALFAAADEAGVGSAIRIRFEEKIKTGLLILVDADSNEILGEITKALTEVEIEETIKSAANTA